MVLTCNTIFFFSGSRGKFSQAMTTLDLGPVKPTLDLGPVKTKASPLECLILMQRENVSVG